jgi:hypothetical protein
MSQFHAIILSDRPSFFPMVAFGTKYESEKRPLESYIGQAVIPMGITDAEEGSVGAFLAEGTGRNVPWLGWVTRGVLLSNVDC